MESGEACHAHLTAPGHSPGRSNPGCGKPVRPGDAIPGFRPMRRPFTGAILLYDLS